jgi:hypothetical protein
MKVPSNIGTILLGIWLILFGVLSAPFLAVSFSHDRDILAIVAVAAGVAVLMKR